MTEPSVTIVGWDVGGAHVKASLLQDGCVLDAAQWACPLWQGLNHLDRTLELARARWPGLARMRHAVTMTGEMVDLFSQREAGVRTIAARMAGALPLGLWFYAGDAGWCAHDAVATNWQHIASANWLATARHTAQALRDSSGVLVDVGSTTTDLIPFAGGRVLSRNRGDAQRLANGELVYHGVVRTPLCAVAHRIALRGTVYNVMNEFFATSADVYRLTGELDPAHDMYPSADNAPKDAAATRQRLGRMVGQDARDASDDDWLAFARAWRMAQLAEIGEQLQRVLASHALDARALIVGAGCGAFLATELAAVDGRRCLAYATEVACIAPAAREGSTAWAQVCAPSIAVASLLHAEQA
jgi:(4-(4-[2-(gamma-L-glutamylamino)ethyl]phenoxymethyl)furan-2-yl)methanamine synthase